MKRYMWQTAIVIALGPLVPIGVARGSEASQAKLDAGIFVMVWSSTLALLGGSLQSIDFYSRTTANARNIW